MARLEQVVLLDPPYELKFRGPFNDIVASKLTLTNSVNKRVCFKVKTTAPRRYCVRPNSGVLEPNSKVLVMLMLQPFEFDPHEKNKHKFMVQTMYMPDGDNNVETLFRESDPSQVMDSKLRCVFEMPPDANAATTTTTESSGDSAPAKDSSASTGDAVSSVTSAASGTAEGTSAMIVTELQRAADEIKKLRTETSSLRQENLNLKEEKLKLQAANVGQGPRSAGSNMVTLQEPQPMFDHMRLLSMVLMALLGYLIAKFGF